MCRALRARNKLGFIDGRLVKPIDLEDSMFFAWERCNNMVVSWIQNLISPAVKSNVAFVDGAQDVWNELRLHFT